MLVDGERFEKVVRVFQARENALRGMEEHDDRFEMMGRVGKVSTRLIDLLNFLGRF